MIYYTDYKDKDLKLKIKIESIMDGCACVDFEIKAISLINFRKEYVLSEYSKLFKELSNHLRNDSYFWETIEYDYMEKKNEEEIDKQFLYLMEEYA